jgi:hypothetical protein
LVCCCLMFHQIGGGVRSGLEAEKVETEEAAGTERSSFRFLTRSSIQNPDDQAVLVCTEPGSTGNEVLAGYNDWLRTDHLGRGGRAIIAFVSVGGNNDRMAIKDVEIQS